MAGKRPPTTDHHSPTTVMNIYEFTLALGAAGLGIMGLSGFAHTVGGHHGADASPSSHTGHHAVSARAGARSGGGRVGGRALWALLSPRPLFSILVGFGAVGLVLHSIVPGAALFAVAAYVSASLSSCRRSSRRSCATSRPERFASSAGSPAER